MITLYRSYTSLMLGIAEGRYQDKVLLDPACRFFFGCSWPLATNPERSLRENFYVGTPAPIVPTSDVDALRNIVGLFAAYYGADVANLQSRTRFAKDHHGVKTATSATIEHLLDWPFATFERHLQGSRIKAENVVDSYSDLEEAVEIVNLSGIDPQVKVVWRR
jgi:hypothetical protein